MPSFHATRIASAISITILILISESIARELRPSDHGLGYQSMPPTGLKSPDTMSFFGANSNSSPSSAVAFPKATNSSNETTWWSAGGNRRGSDRLRKVLLWGSLGCGVTGLALLSVSALVYFIKVRPSPSTHSTKSNSNSLVPITM